MGHPDKKINKETLGQMDLTDVYRIFHLTTAQDTFFSTTHGTFSNIDCILGPKALVEWLKW
jgi:hypothetical protein